MLQIVAIIAVVFASIWSYRGWGTVACIAVAVGGGVVVVVLPSVLGPVAWYASWVLMAGGVMGALFVISLAQKAMFRKVAEGEDDEPVGYPYPGAPGQQPPPQQPPACPACQAPGMQWVSEYQRWYCQSCQDYR